MTNEEFLLVQNALRMIGRDYKDFGISTRDRKRLFVADQIINGIRTRQNRKKVHEPTDDFRTSLTMTNVAWGQER